jgi:ribonucleoside-diphosphate reductase alpha chain
MSTDLSPRSDCEDSETNYVVVTRTGRKEQLDTNQITKRLQSLMNKSPKIYHINPFNLMLKVLDGLKSGITTYEIDEYAANASASLSISNPHYLSIAARIAVDNHQKNTMRSFVDKMRAAYMNIDDDESYPLISSVFFKYVEEHQDFIESNIDYSRDFLIDFFGIRTFQKGYSIQVNKKPIERPQDMFMRTAIAINMYTCDNIDEELANIKETYDMMSLKYYSHASPTYYNAGSVYAQLASCFLLSTEDSLEGIKKTSTDICKISKRAGGIGIDISSWRSTGSKIRGTNGQSGGIVPFCRGYETDMIAFNQGGRRPGAAALYLRMHHPDLMKFIALRKNTGVEEERARKLFYSLWISDLFMKRVEADGNWSVFDSKKCPELLKVYNLEYENLYLKLESEKKYSFQLKARDIWKEIYNVEQETGMPYIHFADAVNRANMHSNIGNINCSNLCVSGDTMILVDTGYVAIQELAGTEIPVHKVWNGVEFTNATFSKTGTNKKLMKITFSDGSILKCTPEHRFALHDVNGNSDVHITATAKLLQVGDRLIACKFPVIKEGLSDYESPYMRGNNYNSYLYDNDGVDIQNLEYQLAHAELMVPINYDLHTKLLWLAGYLDCEVKSVEEDETKLVYTIGTNRKFMFDVKLLCNTLGINPSLVLHKPTSRRLLIDGNGDKEYYPRYASYMLMFSNIDINKLYTLGLTPSQELRSNPYWQRGNQLVTVESIEQLDGLHDTYCFNEPIKHMGIFNGVLAMNCGEIVLYSSPEEYAVCVLASISLPTFVLDGYSTEELELAENERRKLNHTYPVNPYFDFKGLMGAVKVAVRNLNYIVDTTKHPVIETQRGNERHRAIGTGTQGQDDAYSKMRYPFVSESSTKLNKEIYECMYFAALTASTVLCRKEWQRLKKKCKANGTVTVKTFKPTDYEEHSVTYTSADDIPKNVAAYPSMLWNGGSPISKGIFHWELMGTKKEELSGMFDWESLRTHILEFGVKNSHLIALMPTASTSQLFGNNECFEPYTTNLYKRDTTAGEFIVIKKYLINDLYNLGLWNNDLKDYLLACEGSIQNIEGIPNNIKELYKTVWEMDQCDLIQQAIDRQPFVDQAQSMNLYFNAFTYAKWNTAMFKAWRGKLKTGKYYLHTQPASMPTKFTIDPSKQKEMAELLHKTKRGTAFLEPLRDVCESCSG